MSRENVSLPGALRSISTARPRVSARGLAVTDVGADQVQAASLCFQQAINLSMSPCRTTSRGSDAWRTGGPE